MDGEDWKPLDIQSSAYDGLGGVEPCMGCGDNTRVHGGLAADIYAFVFSLGIGSCAACKGMALMGPSSDVKEYI